MLRIHPCARTTPAVRAEVARSTEPAGVLARRYGVSTETVRKSGAGAGPRTAATAPPARPHKLPWKADEEERAVVCGLRRATGFPLDDLTLGVRHVPPDLDRGNVQRILRAEGLGRRPPGPGGRGARSRATSSASRPPRTSSTRPSRVRPMARSAGATCSWRPTAAPARCTRPSGTTGPRRAPSPS